MNYNSFVDNLLSLPQEIIINILSNLSSQDLFDIYESGCEELSRHIKYINRKQYLEKNVKINPNKKLNKLMCINNIFINKTSSTHDTNLDSTTHKCSHDKTSTYIEQYMEQYIDKYWFIEYCIDFEDDDDDNNYNYCEIMNCFVKYLAKCSENNLKNNGNNMVYICCSINVVYQEDKQKLRKFNNIYSLSIMDGSEVDDETLSYISNIDVLRIYNTVYVTSLYTLKNVKNISIGSLYCDISDISNCKNMNAVSIIAGTQIRDVSMLGGLHTLLIYSSFVKDVNMLKNLTNLTLQSSYIEDVSALGGLNYLDVSYNYSITDVNALSRVKYLHISNCTGVTDVSALGSVHYLNMSGCTGVTDVSALGDVHYLDISKCTGITDVTALAHVHTLHMFSCPNVEDICNFENHTLNICGTTNPDYIGQFSSKIQKLIVSDGLYFGAHTKWLFDNIPKDRIFYVIRSTGGYEGFSVV